MLKYLRQAKKNGNLFPVLMGMLVMTGIGLSMTVITIYELAVYGELQSFIAPLDSVAAVANVPAGRIIIGIFVTYIGIIALPRWSRYTQLREEYRVICDEEYMDINFRKWNWRVKRENFSPTDLFFRDRNHKFVSMTRGYQVYNAIEVFYPEYIGKGEIRGKEDVGAVTDFVNIRTMTPEEKKQYLNKKETGNGCVSAVMGILAFAFGNGAFRLFSEIQQRVMWRDKLALILFCMVCLLISFAFIMVIITMRREKRWILTMDCFAATGYSYQKKEEKVSDGDRRETVYYAKIWDGHSVYLPQWFSISEKDYKGEEPVEFNVYFYKGKNGDMQIDAYVKEKN